MWAVRQGIRAMVFAVAIMAILVSLTGCGGPEQSAYLGKDEYDSQVSFIQWTRQGNSVTGSLSVANYQGAEMSTENMNLTGTISGSDVIIKVDMGYGQSQTMTGTISGDTLTLNVLHADGTFTEVRMVTASVADYNAAVERFRRAADEVSAREIAAQEETDRRRRIDEAANTVKGDLASVEDWVQSLRGDASDIAENLGDTRAHVKATRDAQQETLALHRQDPTDESGEVCISAGGVGIEFAGVEIDLAAVTDACGWAKQEIAQSEGAIQALEENYASLQSLMAEEPGYQPDGVPSAAEVTDAKSKAENEIARLQKTISSARAEGKRLLAEAKGYYSSVQGYE